MKNGILVGLAFLLVAGCTTFDRSQPTTRKEIKDVNYQTKKNDNSPRKRVIVLPFLDVSDKRPAEFRDKARAAFIADLNRTGELIALDSKELNIDLSKMIEGSQYKMTEVAKAAQALGVNAVLEGKINDIRIKRKSDNVGVVRHLSTQFEVVAQVRIIQARTGNEIFNTVKTVTVEEQGVRVAERVETDRFLANNPEMVEIIVKDAFLDFSPQVIAALDRVAWEGRIAAINGDRLYLNVGKISGIQMGDLLKVLEDGDDVYDPESGTHIGRVPGRLKGTLEVISYFGNDGAIAIIHSGSGFKENDRVELY
jgi:TolB-like protein